MLQGMSPLAPEYGVEQPGQEGRLTVAGPGGTLATTPDLAAPGNYLSLFEAVHQTLRHHAPYPIGEEQLLWQNELLAATPAAAWAKT